MRVLKNRHVGDAPVILVLIKRVHFVGVTVYFDIKSAWNGEL